MPSSSSSTNNLRLNYQLLSYLNQNNFILRETFSYPNGGFSFFYTNQNDAIIIDKNICSQSAKSKDIFDYSTLTNLQNKYMHKFQKVWRFLDDDENLINDFIKTQIEGKSALSDPFQKIKSISREENLNASPLEYYFEEKFTDVYGTESLKFLNKEFALNDSEGNSYFLDYLIQSENDKFGIEENGIFYHHPQIIGKERYSRQLKKQNTCTDWGIKLFRFSTNDCKDDRIKDSIRTYFGKDTSHFKENGLIVDRKIKLYEHQEITLKNIQEERDKGIKTFLVVFPTASGKSKIIEEDIKAFSKNNADFRALILAPNTAITDDWQVRIQKNLSEQESKIKIATFASIIRNYEDFPPDYFSYIVIDEAHHAVSPVLKRVIQYFTPDFLIGLTATDQRPDKKKLETIFGSYKTSLTLEEAMKKKIIARANVYRIETNIDLSHVRINGKEYVNADLEKNIRVTSRNDLIAQVLKDYFTSGSLAKSQGLVFCVNTDHTKEMAKVLNEYGISAKAYSSRESQTDKIMHDFKEKKIRFLCTCSMISEGWDYPELKILVMARPTLSKVLYLQQIGRGLRKTKSKENVFILDVVDEYGLAVCPCTMHSIFQNPYYVPFGEITNRTYKSGDFITVDGITERIEKISEVNISDFSQKYADYLSSEQVAQDFFVSTETINNWIRTKKIKPTVSFSFGTKKIHLFSKDDVEKYRRLLNIRIHDETTMYDDFFEFLELRDYTFSYKMPFLLSFLKNMTSVGEAKIDDILLDFTNFYKNRLSHNFKVDRQNCPFTKDYVSDRLKMKQNMLSNPFEKFERKRFMYFSKDLNLISINTALFEKLDEDSLQKIKTQMLSDLKNYFENLGGLYENDPLVWFAKSKANVNYIIPEPQPLMVADSGANNE